MKCVALVFIHRKLQKILINIYFWLKKEINHVHIFRKLLSIIITYLIDVSISRNKFSLLFSNWKSYSLKIDSPEEYLKFMAGDSRVSFPYVEFTQNAYASIEDLDKIPFLTSYQALHFHDIHNNYLRLSPKAQSVYGRFVSGKEILACLPRNYVSYELSLGKDVVITTEDIEAMLTWREAKRILITDMANLAYDLCLRIDEMPKSGTCTDSCSRCSAIPTNSWTWKSWWITC